VLNPPLRTRCFLVGGSPSLQAAKNRRSHATRKRVRWQARGLRVLYGSERFEPTPGVAKFSKEVDRRVAGSLSIGRAARRCLATLGKRSADFKRWRARRFAPIGELAAAPLGGAPSVPHVSAR